MGTNNFPVNPQHLLPYPSLPKRNDALHAEGFLLAVSVRERKAENFQSVFISTHSFGLLLIRQTANQVSNRIIVIVVSESAEDLLLGLRLLGLRLLGLRLRLLGLRLRLLGLSRCGLCLCL